MDYLCITSEDNWKVCKARGVWGVKDEKEYGDTTNKVVINKVKTGDTLLIYVKTPKKAALVVYKVKSQVYIDNTPLWDDGIYSMRINMEFERAVEIPYKVLMSGILKRDDGRVINDRQQLRKEMIALQNDSIKQFS